VITGKILRDAMINGAICIANEKRAVDELNVYPVPDGDTGTNMSMTMSAALRALELLADDVPVSQVAETAASALLRGARGNSGVILSLSSEASQRALQVKLRLTARDLPRLSDSALKMHTRLL